MIEHVKNYFAELSAAIGLWWNRFWFTPAPATTLGVIRVLTGLLSLYAIATYAPDLERWFSPQGMLPAAMVEEMYVGQFSIFDFLPPNLLWPAYWATLVVLALFTAGIGGRVTAIVAAIMTLSFFGRAPLVTSEFETILAILLVYLCVGRASDALSLHSFLNRNSTLASRPSPLAPSNTISLRLIQIHLAAVHLLMGWAQLAGPESSWWSGEGIWLAAMRPGMALVDFSFLTNHPRIVGGWSHVITLYLLAFPVFVWMRLGRPLVLAVGVFVWVTLALASGWVMFCLAMLTGLVAYVELPRLAPATVANATGSAPRPALR